MTSNQLPERLQYSGAILRLRSSRAISLHAWLRDGGYTGVLESEQVNGARWNHYRVQPGFIKGDGNEDLEGRVSFIVRESQTRFTIVAKDDVLVDRFLARIGATHIVDRPHIDIGRIVRLLVDGEPGTAERRYLIRAVWASVEGYGPSLKTMSFFGENVAEGRLFTDALGSLSPFRVGVRELRSDAEILSVGNNGELNFFYRGGEHLNAIDRFLRYVNERELITWL